MLNRPCKTSGIVDMQDNMGTIAFADFVLDPD
jgi:hypothetical protein